MEKTSCFNVGLFQFSWINKPFLNLAKLEASKLLDGMPCRDWLHSFSLRDRLYQVISDGTLWFGAASKARCVLVLLAMMCVKSNAV